jgi:hypothetical protein
MDEFVFFSLFGGLIAMTLGFGFAWLSARNRAARLEGELSQRRTAPARDTLETRLNELTTQVEELARSQDFLHRLITRKLERLPVPAERPREITPH